MIKKIKLLAIILLTINLNIHSAEVEDRYLCDISGLNRIEVLKALFAGAEVISKNSPIEVLKLLDYELTDEEAETALMISQLPDSFGKVDYVRGRLIKITFDFDNNVINTRSYNWQYGENAAEEIIERLKQKLEENNRKQRKTSCCQILFRY